MIESVIGFQLKNHEQEASAEKNGSKTKKRIDNKR